MAVSGLILEQIKQTSKYDRFCRLINEDLNTLQKGGFVKKNGVEVEYEYSEKFRQVKELVWVYLHSNSTVASACKFENFNECS